MGKTWTEEDMKQALEKAENRSVSIRAPVKKYGMTEGTLRMQIKMKKENESIVGGGRSQTFDKDVEKELTECISFMCKFEFSPNKSQLKDIVQNYVTANNIRMPFTNNRPDKD